MDELQRVKKSLRQWESEFFQEHKRKPSKEDLENAPTKISKAYQRYLELKKGPQPEVWGKELNKSTSAVKASNVVPQKKSTAMSDMGKKLLERSSSLTSTPKTLPSKLSSSSRPDADDDETPTRSSVFDAAMKLTNVGKPEARATSTDQSVNKFSVGKKTTSFLSSLSSPRAVTAVSVDDDDVALNDETTSRKQILSNQSVNNFSTGKKTTSFLSSLSSPRAVTSVSVDEDPLNDNSETTSRKRILSSNDTQEPAAKRQMLSVSDSDAEEDNDYASFTGKKQSKKKANPEAKRVMDVSPSGSEAEDDDKGGNTRKPNKTGKSKDPPKEKKKRQRRTKASDDVVGDNFVKLNMKGKRYKPKGGPSDGRPMTWKQRLQQRLKKRGTCFKCGEEGHWARDCRSQKEPDGFFGIKDDDGDGDAAKSSFKPTGTCFRCGQEGHWARQCKGQGQNSKANIDWTPGSGRAEEFVQNQDYDCNREVTDDEFPSMEEAVMMARGIKTMPLHNAGPIADLNEEFYDTDSSLGIIRAPFKKPSPVRCMNPLYQLNADGSLPETPPEVYSALERFGFTGFRLGQETAIMRVLCGLSTLVVLSTGAGKSLCYQLPAYLYAKRSRCITLVVSPLVSLMQDQVSELPDCISGACIHANMTPAQRRSVLESVAAGKFHFLLLSPEMLVGGGGVYSGISSGLLSRLPPIAFVCIDEAHCVSEWSHHFRPSYLRVCSVLREEFGVKCMLGLTATATMTTAISVAQHLGIVDNESATIRGAPIPANLKLSVSRDSNREQALIKLLRGSMFSRCRSIIIYCTRREQTARVAALLRSSMKDFFGDADDRDATDSDGDATPPRGKKKKRKGAGFRRKSNTGSWKAECYHAGMGATARKTIQEDFMSGRLRVVVATVAFGMGLNKSDIRGIIHFTMPKNIESYVQEIGRAGRDGETAYCHLFLDCKGEDRNELKRHIFSRSVDRISVKRLIRNVFVPCRCKSPSPVTVSQPQETEPQQQSVTDKSESVVEGFDVSGLDTPWDDLEDGSTDASTQPNSSRRVGVCPCHERVLPIEDLVSLLDMKEEVIETLLCYMELHPKKWIENLQPIFSQCTVHFYGGRAQMLAVAKRCPPIAVVIAKLKQQGSLESLTNKLEFNIVELSDSMGWDSNPVKKELKLLEWDLGPEGSKKTGIVVEFTTLSYHIRSPGDMTDDELDEVVDFLMERIETQEKTELFHLENFHETLASVSYKNVQSCCDFPDSERSEKLRSKLHHYLECKPPPANEMSTLTFAREMDAVAAEQAENSQEEEVCDKEDAIRADVRSFVQLYGEEHKLTGRAIARVFQGIDSPRFPATVWGRVRRFWRAHLDVDFHMLRRIATRELLRCR